MMVLSRMPPRLKTFFTPARRQLMGQFVRFGVVGVAGLGVDIATVYLTMGTVGLYASGLLAYGTAVTTTWALNRAWTFAGLGDGRAGLFRQWAMFVAANGVGFVLNRGTFFLLVALVPLCAAHPVLAIVPGVLAGLLANFNLSRNLVFRAGHDPRKAG